MPAASRQLKAPAAGAVEEIVVTRSFDAPRERVFEAWSTAEHLVQWFAPMSGSVPHCTVDFRVGGRFHLCMRFPGQDIWVLGEYREIAAPERIVYMDRFADEHGNPVPPSRYGMSTRHPAETLVRVTFSAQGAGTLLTLRHDFPGAAAERDDCEQGWREMFKRLAVHTARR